MNHRDLVMLTDAFAPVLREFVDDAVASILKRLDALEAGRSEDGEALTAVRRDLATLPKMDEVLAALPKSPTAEEVSALAPPSKGINLEALIKPIEDFMTKRLAEVPPPKDGKDADAAQIEAAAKAAVEALPRPQDGKSVTVEDCRPLIEECVHAAVSALPKAKDGDPGPKGDKGDDGERGEPGEKGDPGRDGVGLSGALIDRDDNLVLTLTDGKTVSLGVVVGKDGAPGKDGADGLGFDDLSVEDAGMEFVLRFARGEQVKEFRLAKPTLADMHAGVWKAGAHRRGTCVTWGGSMWLAKCDTEAKPETNDDWVLVTKRGQNGKDGEFKAASPPALVKLK
jgi:hypothetical protein